jgi:Domain of unknown function (DUF4281)
VHREVVAKRMLAVASVEVVRTAIHRKDLPGDWNQVPRRLSEPKGRRNALEVVMPIAALPLPLEVIFSLANSTALLSWCVLILLPRTPTVRRLVQVLAVGGLCLAYAVLIQLYFFSVPGGGFGTLAAVQRLFEAPEVALAGWIHYLAFDLFVGLWMAQRADAMGLSRWLQAPVLVVTFMFGPIGLLLFGLWWCARKADADWGWRRRPTAETNP